MPLFAIVTQDWGGRIEGFETFEIDSSARARRVAHLIYDEGIAAVVNLLDTEGETLLTLDRRDSRKLSMFRKLKKENPHLELDELWAKVGVHQSKGDHPSWAKNAPHLRSVIVKRPPKVPT